MRRKTIKPRASFHYPINTYESMHEDGGAAGNWLKPFRVVVTAVRPNGQMCQIVDVRGYEEGEERFFLDASGRRHRHPHREGRFYGFKEPLTTSR